MAAGRSPSELARTSRSFLEAMFAFNTAAAIKKVKTALIRL